MKYLLTVLISFTVVAAAHSQNPYESIGRHSEMLTLSGGAYEEFIADAKIVRIGSVLFDTEENKVVAFIDTDADAEPFEPEVRSRFLSVDPLAAKYPSISPYAYVANNPLRYIDPDGRQIVDRNGNVVGVNINEDENGNRSVNFTFADGTSQETIDHFNENAGVVVNSMLATSIGIEQINEMVNSDVMISVIMSDERMVYTNEQGQQVVRFGGTTITGYSEENGQFVATSATMTIYGGSVGLIAAQTRSLSGKLGLFQQAGRSGTIGSVGVHESVHASDPQNIHQNLSNQFRGTNYDIERVPDALQILFLQQLLS